MAASPDTVRSATIIRIADGAVFVEASLASDAESYFGRARSALEQLREFDKKRKDHGKIDLDDGVLHYEIDTESIGHVLYTAKDYPERAAREFLKELVKRLEKAVENPEEADPAAVRRSMAGPAKDLLGKYKVAPDLPEIESTSKSSAGVKNVGLKVDQAKDMVSKQIRQAAANEQDLQMIDDKSKRTKLLAAEMEYETEDLKDTMTWRNRKLMIIGGIVGGALILAIIIAAVK